VSSGPSKTEPPDSARILASAQDATEVLRFQGEERETQSRYQALIEASAQIVWTTDPSGAVVEDSPSWRSFTGQTYEQWKGFGGLEAVHPDDRERVSDLWRRAVAEGAALETEYRIRHISGDWRWTTVRAVPVLDADGSIREWVGMNIDITVRKQGEEARARLAAIVESSDDAIVSKDLTGVITSWNKSAERLFGYTAQEAVGNPVTLLIPPDRFDEEPAILERVRRGERIDHYETVRRRKDGTLLDVSLTVSPVTDSQGRVVGASKIARDITGRKRAENRLRESEERFAQFMRHLPGLAWIKNAEGRYLYANNAAEVAFGSRLVELQGKTDQDLFPAETAAQFTMNDQRALASGSGIQAIETLKHPDGTVRHSIVSKFPVPGRDGKEITIGGIAFDITEQREAEEALRESEQRFRLLADSVPVLIWLNGLDGCEFVNRAYLQFLERPMEDIQQMKWATALHIEDAQAYLDAYREAFEGRKPFEAQVRMRRADGEYRWLKSAALPRVATEGKFLGYVGCSFDITDVKQYQEALSEADRRKNEFLAMLAHELRNPLAPIRNALEIIRRTQNNGQAIQSASEMMERQINQMVRLVDDLLDVSRISRGRIELRRGPIELASAVNHAVEASRLLAESKGIELSVSMPPQPVYLNADPIRMAQVVGNLLNNACKFTADGGRIWLTVELARAGDHSPEGVLIRVRDTGIGIPAEQLNRIFDMFMQGDTSLERSTSGLGIGLTLAKNLVELHEGTLEAHSAGTGQGSEFVVRLPVLTEDPKPAPPDPVLAESKTAAARRILVVDDNEDSAESLTILLNLAGHKTHTAYDGLEAIEAAATFRPDVILLDIGLPKLNGYEVARKIREQPWGQAVVLVALTGWGQEEDRRRSREAGFNHHLTKPVDPLALTRLLASLSLAQNAN
jgi:PAS domain S-box-containing protein